MSLFRIGPIGLIKESRTSSHTEMKGRPEIFNHTTLGIIRSDICDLEKDFIQILKSSQHQVWISSFSRKVNKNLFEDSVVILMKLKPKLYRISARESLLIFL